MNIREQMAEQLCADLRQVAAENDKLQRNYADEVRWEQKLLEIAPSPQLAVCSAEARA